MGGGLKGHELVTHWLESEVFGGLSGSKSSKPLGMLALQRRNQKLRGVMSVSFP